MLNTKKIFSALVLSSMLTIHSLPVFAETSPETTQTPTTSVTEVNTTTTTDTSTSTTTSPSPVSTTVQDQNLADAINKTYGISITAQDVATQRSTGLGYGEISKAYGLAALSGKTVGDITGMKQTMGWGQIAESLGIKVSDVTRNEKAVEKAITSKKSSSTQLSKQKPTSSSKSSTSSRKGNSSRGGTGGKGGNGPGGGGRK